MSNVPANLKYAASHEWMLLNADGTVTVGITDHAQEALGDLVYVELPEVGAHYDAEKELAVVESVKAAADAPETVNQDAYAAWLFKLKPDNAADLDGLLDAAAYAKVAAES